MNKLFFLISLFFVTPIFCVPDKVITIWVHGTNPPPQFLFMSSRSPFRPWLYAAPGLTLATDLPSNYYFYKLAHACSTSDPVEFALQDFYTFGWPSATLSTATRKKQGVLLHKALNKIIDACDSQGCKHLKIRVVGFSHGCNVILNMIQHLPFVQPDVQLELVLLAIPVQELTRGLINSPHITRAYSFYTDADWMQALDPQKLYNWGSNVPWFSSKRFKPSDQVVEVKLTINGKAIGHRGFRDINHHLPSILKLLQDLIEPDQKSGHLMLDFVTT